MTFGTFASNNFNEKDCLLFCYDSYYISIHFLIFNFLLSDFKNYQTWYLLILILKTEINKQHFCQIPLF